MHLTPLVVMASQQVIGPNLRVTDVSAESFTMLTKQGNGTDSFRNPPLAATDELVPSRAEPSEVAAWKPVDVC
jgi:hypothetical protein